VIPQVADRHKEEKKKRVVAGQTRERVELQRRIKQVPRSKSGKKRGEKKGHGWHFLEFKERGGKRRIGPLAFVKRGKEYATEKEKEKVPVLYGKKGREKNSIPEFIHEQGQSAAAIVITTVWWEKRKRPPHPNPAAGAPVAPRGCERQKEKTQEERVLVKREEAYRLAGQWEEVKGRRIISPKKKERMPL